MDVAARKFCLSAIACLKVPVAQGHGIAVALGDLDSPVLRNLDNGLLVSYLVDQGDHFSYVQNRHLAQAGLSEAKLHEQALLNLSSVVGAQAEVRKFGSIYIVVAGGTFEASLILCDEFWSTWYEDLAGKGFIVTFPARDVLAFGDSGDDDTVGELKELCAKTAGLLEHPLTTTLYRRVDAAWQPVFAH
jgi:uncharacterized protein YtpQ (UPF0354 family)